MKKNIVHIIPNFNYGGAEIYLLDILKNIDKSKYNVSVITLFKNVSFFEKELLEVNGLTTFFLDSNSILSFSGYFNLLKSIKKIKPNIIHTHLNVGILIFGFLKLFFRQPFYVFTQHSVYYKKSFYYRFLRCLVAKFDIVHANSKFTKEQLLKLYNLDASKIKAIPLGVDFNRYNLNSQNDNSLTDVRIPENKFIIGNIGRFKHHKGHKYLIEAFNLSYKQDSNLHLVLIGNGDLKNESKDQVLKFNIEDNVTFLDETKDVSKYFNLFDVYCSSSVSESFGITVLEAIMFNLPVISFNTDALPELIIDNYTGLLVDKTNVKELSKNLLEIKNNKDLYHSIKSNLENFSKNYTITNHLMKLEEIYDSV